MTTEMDTRRSAGRPARSRWLAAAACALAVVTAGCGGSDVVGQLTPSRVVSFGDGYTDLSTGAEWTVKNTAQPSIWVRQLALRYGVSGGSLLSDADGGFGYGRGGAALLCRDDAANPCAAAPSSLAEQIQAAISNGHLSGDALAAVMIGATDGLHYAQLAEDGTITDLEFQQRMRDAAAVYVAQLRRLTELNVRVVAVQIPKLGNSPTGLASETLRARLNAATRTLNAEFLRLLGTADNRIDGRDLAVVDGERLFDSVVGDDGDVRLGFLTTRQPACGPGVTALACTSVVPGASTTSWVFAAEVYPTPGFHVQMGDTVYSTTRNRF